MIKDENHSVLLCIHINNVYKTYKNRTPISNKWVIKPKKINLMNLFKIKDMPNNTNLQRKDVKIRTHKDLILRLITITWSRQFLTKIYEIDVLQKGPISFSGLQISVKICVTCYYLSNIKYLLSISLKIAITHKMCFKEMFYYKVKTS